MVLSFSSLHHFPYEALSVCRAPLLQRHYPPSSLLWTHPTPSRLSVHFPLGYRTYLFPGFLRSGEEGLSSCLKCPCNRAVACTPPEESPVSVSLQDFLLSSLDSKQLDFRIQTPFEATMRSRLLRPGYSLTTLSVALSTDSRTVRFLPACCPSYGVLTFSPAGLLSSC